MPPGIRDYHEPFLGGGAAFFAIRPLQAAGRHAFLSDIHIELVLTWRVLQGDPGTLIRLLREHDRQHRSNPGHYYEVREAHAQRTPAHTAARAIYLNKTAFNGLRRFNRAGRFNVPKGRYADPKICDPEALMEAHQALKPAWQVRLRAMDFSRVQPAPGDFIYCDPPYDQTFTAYHRGGFSSADQERLRNCARDWHAAGAQVMISNSDTPAIRALYSGAPFRAHPVQAPRSISRKADGRKPVQELLYTTY